MRIIKHGVNYKEERNFKCPKCGCEFILSQEEYREHTYSRFSYGMSIDKKGEQFIFQCPECPNLFKEYKSIEELKFMSSYKEN